MVLYDGLCPLCVGAVRWVLRADREEIFRFAALNSAAAIRLIEFHRAGPEDLAAVTAGDTLALVERGRVFTRSEAVLRIAARLGFPWKAAIFMRVVPRNIRDRAYRIVARRRHELWGRLDACHAPAAHHRHRFL